MSSVANKIQIWLYKITVGFLRRETNLADYKNNCLKTFVYNEAYLNLITLIQVLQFTVELVWDIFQAEGKEKMRLLRKASFGDILFEQWRLDSMLSGIYFLVLCMGTLSRYGILTFFCCCLRKKIWYLGGTHILSHYWGQ